MVAHAALDAQAECPDLARIGAARVAPAAGLALAPAGLDAERGAGRGEGRLERADERPDHQPARAEGQDRVGDELARAVIRHLAAALDPDRLDAACGEGGRVGPDVGRVRCPAEGQDRWMLEQQEPVADPSLGALDHEALLERQCRPGSPTRPSHVATIGPGTGVDPLRSGASVSIATMAR